MRLKKVILEPQEISMPEGRTDEIRIVIDRNVHSYTIQMRYEAKILSEFKYNFLKKKSEDNEMEIVIPLRFKI